MTSEDAGIHVGVAPVVGSRWFREHGGMPPHGFPPLSARYLSFAEREEIALLRAQGAGVRAVARRLDRSPSTISRELRRNAATRGGKLEYRATNAQWHADRRARRPKTSKLAANEQLRCLCRTGSAAWSSARTAHQCRAPPSPGSAVGTGAAWTAGGPRRGARSSSPLAGRVS
jgi:transposase-like protein